jgi:hypothetical protein
VAVPSLIPFTFFSENPAVIQWGAPSRVGVQVFQAQQVTDPSTVKDNFQGYAGGVRGVWEYFSIAAEGSHQESTNKPFGPTETTDYGAAAIAVGLGRHFSIGLGTEHTEYGFSGFHIYKMMQVNQTKTFDTPVAGLTVRLGEWLFLGGAIGREMFSLNNRITPTSNLPDQRDVYKYGAAIRAGGTV